MGLWSKKSVTALQAEAAQRGGLRLLPGAFMAIRQALGCPRARGDEAAGGGRTDGARREGGRADLVVHQAKGAMLRQQLLAVAPPPSYGTSDSIIRWAFSILAASLGSLILAAAWAASTCACSSSLSLAVSACSIMTSLR